jgi:hypothetical protein
MKRVNAPPATSVRLAGIINPDTIAVEVFLEIACDDPPQVISRPVGTGYGYEDLIGEYVLFSGWQEEAGAVPASARSEHEDDESLNAEGFCSSAEFNLAAKTFAGADLHLGVFRSMDELEMARCAIVEPVQQLLRVISPEMEVAFTGPDAERQDGPSV